MRRAPIVLAGLLAAVLGASSRLSAEDAAPPAGKGPDAPKAGGGDAKKDEATLRVERAKQLVKELEASVARVKAAQPLDAQLLQQLLLALEQARALAQPAKPAELTADEKKAVLDEAKKDAGADKPKDPPNPLADWQEKALAKAFEGAELTEEEAIKAKKVVGDWWPENLAAMGDSKKQSDLKRKRDDELEKAVGKKKAMKIINNLNAMGPGRK